MAADALRAHLKRLLAWEDAHVSFEKAVAGIPREFQDKRPKELPYSPWQLLEHLRLAQRDILDFCRDPDYEEPSGMEAYWPSSAAPPTPRSWKESVASFRADLEAVEQLAMDPTIDLLAAVPRGSGQTYLREILLVADHNAYHVGQLVAVRRLLGIWESA